MEKKFEVLTAGTSRELKNLVNEKGIQKEDIVGCFWREDQFILFYYQ